MRSWASSPPTRFSRLPPRFTDPTPGPVSAGETAGAASLAVHTQDLAKRYGRTVALTALTMDVRRAEVFGFLGPNGAGKTTAVKLLVGLARPTAGQAWVLGAPAGDRPTRRRLGYLPELFRYQPWLSAREVLGLHCQLAGIAAASRRQEIDGALAWVGLADRADDRVGGYSKGMQQPCSAPPSWSSSTSPRPPSTPWAATTSGRSSAASRPTAPRSSSTPTC